MTPEAAQLIIFFAFCAIACSVAQHYLKRTS